MLKQEEISIKVENALKKINKRNSLDNNNLKTKNSSIYICEKGVEYNTHERVVNSVKPPISTIPNDEELFPIKDIPDYNFLKNHFQREGRLSEDQLIKIIELAENIMKDEPNLLNLEAPTTVVGDIHGQFYDLIGMFEMCGDPKDTQYLFLGDYVDRGDRSIEVLILLYSMKINFPKSFWLLRGNHESKRMTSYFTFQRECLRRYSNKLYKSSTKSFSTLPLCAVLNKKLFCVHAGISSKLWDLNDINTKINRFTEDFPSKGLFCDLMWSDPSNNYDDEEIDENDIENYFSFNNERRCSEFYTYNAVETFLNNNDLLSIIRGHQPQDSGYRMYKINSNTGFPTLFTIFSAPNYCGTYNNMAAVLVYKGDTFNIKQFDSYPSPYYLPDQMNLFEWSLPFVSEKVIEILSSVLNICTEDELNNDEIHLNKENIKLIHEIDENEIEEERNKNEINEDEEKKEDEDKDEDEDEDEDEEKNENEISNEPTPPIMFGESLKKKMMMVGRMSRILSLLREEREKVEELKELNDGKLPKQTLIDGREELSNQIKSFKEARDLDLKNEALPPSNAEIKAKALLWKKRIDDVASE